MAAAVVLLAVASSIREEERRRDLGVKHDTWASKETDYRVTDSTDGLEIGIIGMVTGLCFFYSCSLSRNGLDGAGGAIT